MSRKKRCPKCRGTGNSGLLGNYRCDLCSGRGWFDVDVLEEFSAYRKACEAMGVPIVMPKDNTPKPDEDLDKDWPDDFDEDEDPGDPEDSGSWPDAGGDD